MNGDTTITEAAICTTHALAFAAGTKALAKDQWG